jgi:hypothetical protein
MFVISLDIFLDRSPGITEPSAGLMEREVSSLDRKHEPQAIEYILVLEHGFHLDHPEVKTQLDCYCWPGDVLELQKGVVLSVT